VYLVQANYDKVIFESQKIVSPTAPFQYTAGNLNNKLESNFATIFTGSYTGSEAIFSIPFANTTTETPASQFSLAYNYLSQPIIFLAAAGIASDPALNSPSDARSSLISTNAAKQKVLKKFSIITAPFRDYVPVIRYAEVLLNYAEAKLELGQALDYNKSLNLLRSRAGMPNFTTIADANRPNYADWGYGVTDELNEVRRERAVELACEEFCYVDWRRWAHSRNTSPEARQCQKDNLFFETLPGKGAGGLDTLQVHCRSCKSRRNLMGITTKGSLKTIGVIITGR